MIPLFDMEEIEPSSKTNEWYTPAKYIEAARKVMGGIDLDPATCELANKTVKATKYHTKENNGLMQRHGAHLAQSSIRTHTPRTKRIYQKLTEILHREALTGIFSKTHRASHSAFTRKFMFYAMVSTPMEPFTLLPQRKN